MLPVCERPDYGGSMRRQTNQCKANGDFARNFAPIILNTNGSGIQSVMIPARSAVSPTVPSLLYIWPANNGNAAAKDDRAKAFADIADAAIGR